MMNRIHGAMGSGGVQAPIYLPPRPAISIAGHGRPPTRYTSIISSTSQELKSDYIIGFYNEIG